LLSQTAGDHGLLRPYSYDQKNGVAFGRHSAAEVTTHTYDRIDNPVRIDHPDGPSRTFSYDSPSDVAGDDAAGYPAEDDSLPGPATIVEPPGPGPDDPVS
jgi:hypothetical protein